MPQSSLRVRPGARFTCHGDGLCCTDVHALGPVSEKEAGVLSAIHPEIVTLHHGDRVLGTRDDGACMFLGAGRCELHAALGPSVKPLSCNQFPFILVSTPVGARVVTEHRCPCRTLGAREPLSSEVAREACPGTPDRVVRTTLPMSASEEFDLPTWEAMEAPLLERLARGEDPLEVLNVAPFAGGAWDALAATHEDEDESSRFGAAVRCFADATRGATSREPLPWQAAFDRAEARSEREDAEAMLRDWVADQLFSLEWAFVGTFAQARLELATRVAVARRIAAQEVGGSHPRADRAMAEAIAVVELMGLADEYRAFVATLEEPAQALG